ncbi:MAG: phosphate acyltransferase PlsX [Candidatus Paracaedibacteraceae bacterium]|nr:phosphate acyltransferase PlsX [Candidatus Paracaedibacteraceae bacterium]
MSLCVSLDVMGGDQAPSIVLDGAELALQEVKDVRFHLYGDKNLIKSQLSKHPFLSSKSEIFHCTEVVTSDTKPVDALRRLKDSSMRRAIEAVAEGKCDAVVSAGNTGAYMALSKITLKSLDGIDRPAIAALLPTVHGYCIGLDMGANLECTAENLMQFAVMGDVMARRMLGVKNPTIGLLNVGTEEVKGHAIVQHASQLMKEIPDINYVGFVEGDDINHGVADVVVTDGFTGNVSLKTLEGAAQFIFSTIRNTMESSILGKLSYLVGHKSFKNIKNRLDPRKYNGATFLGLKGIAVKSHGGADAVAFANAIKVAINLAKNSDTLNLGQEIEEKIKEL